jgi:hypothetical protein
MVSVQTAVAGDQPQGRGSLEEPLLRVSKSTTPNSLGHPLDPALEYARNGLKAIQNGIADYTCTLVKRERIQDKLGEPEYIFAKVRNRKVANGKTLQPFSVYMYFLKPTTVKGREVIFIQGQNDGKLIAHEGGPGGKYLPTMWLRPEGLIAMRGQRYPITEMGIENLVYKLIERGEKDKARGTSNTEVTFHKEAKVNGRVCTLLQIKHPKPAPNLDFHMAQIFIDDELKVPIRYVSYGFAGREGEPLPVIEEYTYLNMKLNTGLTDHDFDPANKDYGFN